MAWGVVVLLSWLLSAMMVHGVRSLLSGEGIRWLFAHFSEGISSPVLVWLLLVAIAFGTIRGSQLFSGDGHYRRKTALRMALLLLSLYVAVIALLTLPPHAVLLSATGRLADSPFSRALVPMACCGVVLVGVAYGLVARTFESLSNIVDAMLGGLRAAAPLLLLYLIAAQMLQALAYVFL